MVYENFAVDGSIIFFARKAMTTLCWQTCHNLDAIVEANTHQYQPSYYRLQRDADGMIPRHRIPYNIPVAVCFPPLSVKALGSATSVILRIDMGLPTKLIQTTCLVSRELDFEARNAR